jgi:hypothetical protein
VSVFIVMDDGTPEHVASSVLKAREAVARLAKEKRDFAPTTTPDVWTYVWGGCFRTVVEIVEREIDGD